MFAITVFEIGSAICGSAPSIEVLILGRAIAGCGGAGIFVSLLRGYGAIHNIALAQVSCFSIIATITRLEQRPLFFGLFGGVFGFSSVVGPLLGELHDNTC